MDLNVTGEGMISFLSKTSICSSLSTQDLETLAGLLISKQVSAGETVIHQGDFGDSLYFIYQGEVDIFIHNQEGAENLIGRLKEGDFFGEMALLTGEPRSASARITRDANLLVLHKTDFDRFLREQPRLAVFFSKVLAERIRAANMKYVSQMGREKQLTELLSSGEEQHLTHLIGKTRLFQDIEKRINEQAGDDKPLMIVGPKGTATAGVARLIHLKGRGQDRPFLIVDLGHNDQWRAYFDRIKSSTTTSEQEAQIFEEFQISTLFGHEQGAMTGTESNRLGYVELADRGTVVLKNTDCLSPGTREKLNFYLLEKRFYRLGGKEGIQSDTRIIATLYSPEDGEQTRRSFRGKIPDVLWDNRIDLPPLAMRRRDVPIIAEFFLEKHAILSGKPIKTISPEALNILVRYSWPGNDRELESVIERGVLICDGETLEAEHIFLGLTPYSEKGRVNLFQLPSFRKWFGNQRLRGFIQGATVAVMLGAIVLTLTGPPEASKNLGMGIIWYYWWPFLLLSFLVLGRFYCSICPIHGVTKLSRKFGSLNRPVPRLLNRINVMPAALFTLGLFWAEYLFLIKEIPIRTPILLATIVGSAVLANTIFQQDVWCRYLCPMGFFSGMCSCIASVELRANNNVCSSQCKSTPCYRGDGNQGGCPMKLFPVALTSNQFCKMCGTCVHHCPYNAIHLDMRWPGAELWENKDPNPVTAMAIPALVGILYPLFLHESLRTSQNANLTFTVFYFASALGAVSLFVAACLIRGPAHFKEMLRTYGYTYLPLAFAGHVAFLFPYLLSGVKWLTSLTLEAEFHPHSTSSWPLRLIIAVGILWSGWAIRKVSRGTSSVFPLIHGALVFAFGLTLMLVAGG